MQRRDCRPEQHCVLIENPDERRGEQRNQQPAERGVAEGQLGHEADRAAYPFICFRAVVEADDCRRAIRDRHDRRLRNLANRVEHGHDADVNIAAEGAQRRVAGDLHQTVRERHDKARHAEGGDAADAGEVRPEAAKTDFQLGLPPGQEAQHPQGGKRLRNHGRDGRTAHAEVQCKDKHRVKHDVCDRAHDNGQHSDFRETLTVYVWI